MIFDGKSINDITDQEINELVSNHISERQHLELKAGIDLKDDENRFKLLRDIVSLANGGGGYLIFGIRDDGKGRAQVYDSNYIGDPESLKKTIMSLCHDYITERIDGLEVVSRTIMKNPLVIVRVPTSIRIPHMVKYKNRTDFYTRYHDGKREMTIGEIREAFVNDLVGRRLSIIESMLRNNSKVLQQTGILKDENRNSRHEVKTLLEITDGRLLNETALELFEKEVQQDHYFWLGISPMNPKLKLIDVDSPELKNILDNPPDSRAHGWSMRTYSETEYFAEGIYRGRKDSRLLRIYENGHMEFWTEVNDHFCWAQTSEQLEKRPRLYPFPVVEYPVTFLKLYKAIVENQNIKSDFIIHLRYQNIKGFILVPYAPGTYGFEFGYSDAIPYEENIIDIPNMSIPSDFDPDQISYELIKRVYRAFKLGPETIPFYDQEMKKFSFS